MLAPIGARPLWGALETAEHGRAAGERRAGIGQERKFASIDWPAFLSESGTFDASNEQV